MKRTSKTCWILASAVLLTGLAPSRAQDAREASKASALEGAKLSEIELVRRQEALIRAQQLIEQARKLQSEREYAAALEKYADANKLVIAAPANADEQTAIAEGSLRCLLALSKAAYGEKKYSEAMSFAQRAHEVDPENDDARSLYERAAKAEERSEEKKQETEQAAAAIPKEISNPEFVAKQKRVLELYRAAENYMKSEQFEEAEGALKDILKIDPYSATAYHRLREVQHGKFKKLEAARGQTETELLGDVQQRWRLPIRRDKQTIQLASKDGEGVETVGSKMEILQKLNSLVIKKIEFSDTPIMSAITYLMEESRAVDPKHEGVNIIPTFLKSLAPVPMTTPAPAPMPGVEGAAPAPGVEATAPSADLAALNQPKVSLNIRNVTLLQAVKYLTEVTGLKYRIDTDSVKIVSASEALASSSLQSRSYTVKPTLFKSVVERTDTGGASTTRGASGGFTGLTGDTRVTAETDAKKFLEEFGIDFKSGGSAKYIESLGLLIVTQTNEVLDQIDEIMLKLNKTAPQVTIEAKFIDVRQSDLEELGFEWAFAPATQSQYTIESGRGTALPGIPIGGPYRGLGNPLTGGLRQSISASALDALLGGVSGGTVNTILSITGVLTNPQLQVMIDALSQKGLTNLLSAPRVTTVSGDSAKIMVTREFIYPSTYTDPQVQAGTSSTTGGTAGVGITSPSPSGWTTREIGVILDVKPNVNPDDNLTINLTLSPEVVDFEGFINYNTYAVANSTQFTFTIPQPVFNKRQITTSVIIWDGQTVVLGGLIREDTTKTNDKIPLLGDIPLLGRFFQSKVDSSSKRNLIIFLTARIVDPSGKPVREFTDARITAAPAATETP
ncbi:MAG: hypothetical protein IT578_03460 [Verrucomicrobiae bacterium]|nr:hypothetical protein [Verrucomicrobiae bacterium]